MGSPKRIGRGVGAERENEAKKVITRPWGWNRRNQEKVNPEKTLGGDRPPRRTSTPATLARRRETRTKRNAMFRKDVVRNIRYSSRKKRSRVREERKKKKCR